jgi:hypothetical protein
VADFSDMPSKPKAKNPDSPLSQVNPRMPKVEADRGPVQASEEHNDKFRVDADHPQEQPKGTREAEHVSAAGPSPTKQGPDSDTDHEPSKEEQIKALNSSLESAHAPAHLPGQESTSSGSARQFAGQTVASMVPGGKRLMSFADWAQNRLRGGNAPMSYFDEKTGQELKEGENTWAGAAGKLTGNAALAAATGPLLKGATVAGTALKGAAAGGISDVLENGIPRTKDDALRTGTAMLTGGALNAGGHVAESALSGTGRWVEGHGDSAAMRAAHQGGTAAEALESAQQAGKYVPGTKNRELQKAGVVKFTKEGVREGAAASKSTGGALMNKATEGVPGVPAEVAASKLTGVIQKHGYAQPGASLAGEGIGPVSAVRNKLQGEADVIGAKGNQSLADLLKQKALPGSPEAAEIQRQLEDLVARRQGARAGLRPQDLGAHARDIEEGAHGVTGPGAKVAGAGRDAMRELETSQIPPENVPGYREGQRQYAIGSRSQEGLKASARAAANQEVATRAGMRRSFLSQPLNATIAKGARVAGPTLEGAGAGVRSYASKRAVMPQADTSKDSSQDTSDQWLQTFGAVMNNNKNAPVADPGTTTSFDQAMQSSPEARGAMKRDAATSGGTDKKKNNRVNPGIDTSGD